MAEAKYRKNSYSGKKRQRRSTLPFSKQTLSPMAFCPKCGDYVTFYRDHHGKKRCSHCETRIAD